jgi:hypothetical protein
VGQDRLAGGRNREVTSADALGAGGLVAGLVIYKSWLRALASSAPASRPLTQFGLPISTERLIFAKIERGLLRSALFVDRKKLFDLLLGSIEFFLGAGRESNAFFEKGQRLLQWKIASLEAGDDLG